MKIIHIRSAETLPQPFLEIDFIDWIESKFLGHNSRALPTLEEAVAIAEANGLTVEVSDPEWKIDRIDVDDEGECSFFFKDVSQPMSDRDFVWGSEARILLDRIQEAVNEFHKNHRKSNAG
jgi:hypothetical protein